jgi:hypothetical protein
MIQNFHFGLQSRRSSAYGNRLSADRRAVRVRRYLLALLLCFSLQDALAAETQPLFHFELPAQNLQDALEQYSVITGREVLYDSSIVEGKRSAALTGTWRPEEALPILLQGSGVQAKYVGKDAFTLAQAYPDGPVAPLQSGGREAAMPALKKHFYRRFQSSLTRLLCQDDILKKNAFRAALQFWFNRDGSFESVRLLDTSGSESFDKHILFQARQIHLNAAPPDSVRQPLTIVIDPRIPLICKNSG